MKGNISLDEMLKSKPTGSVCSQPDCRRVSQQSEFISNNAPLAARLTLALCLDGSTRRFSRLKGCVTVWTKVAGNFLLLRAP